MHEIKTLRNIIICTIIASYPSISQGLSNNVGATPIAKPTQNSLQNISNLKLPTLTFNNENSSKTFIAYKNQVSIITIYNPKNLTYKLKINEQEINVNNSALLRLNIAKFLQNGQNKMDIIGIGSTDSIKVNIPYPTLQNLNNPNPQNVNIDKLQSLSKTIQNDVANGFPGAAIIIIKNGQVVYKFADGYKLKYTPNGQLLDTPLKLDQKTVFDIASNSKMYATNYAIMHLVSIGKLNLDAPISQYLTNYHGCDINGECRETRTVRDLLTHSAGYTPDPQFFNPTAISTIDTNLYSQNRQHTQQIIETQLPFASAKGGKPNYSDVDFMLLGMIVERITNQRLDQYVANTFYTPLGLLHTSYNPLEHGFKQSDIAATEVNGNTRGNTISFPNIRSNVIQGQVHDEKAYYSMDGVSGHAGLFSTLSDLAVLCQIMLNNGGYGQLKFWDSNVENQFTAANKQDITYGLGWRRAGEHNLSWFGPYASNQAIGHTGWTGTVTVIDPKYNLAIILLTNKKHSQFANGSFAGDNYATGKYTSIITQAYEAVLDTNSAH